VKLRYSTSRLNGITTTSNGRLNTNSVDQESCVPYFTKSCTPLRSQIR